MRKDRIEKKPLVSVIMAVYNETELELKMAIDSIENQTYTNIEIIIVYDNPENVSLYNFLKDYVKEKFKIKIIKNCLNMGLAKSLNVGIENSRGQYIGRMDADDICVPTRIERQLNFMMCNPDIDILSSECFFINEDNDTLGEFYFPNYTPKQLNSLILYQNFLIHPSWLVKRTVYDDLDGYREFPSAQDYDFLLRAISKGYNTGIIHEKLLFYRIRMNSISSKNSLKQFLTAEYIRELYRERLKKDYDSFSVNRLNKILNQVALRDEVRFKKAIEYYKNNKFLSLKYIFKSKYFKNYISQKVCFTICRLAYRRK